MIKKIDILMYFLAFCFFVVLPLPSCSDNPADPFDPPEEAPCDTVFIEVEVGKVEGVYEIFYIQDPSPNNYVILQNDVSIFNIMTSSAIFEEIRVEVPGNYKKGDVLEIAQDGSDASIRVAFHGNE